MYRDRLARGAGVGAGGAVAEAATHLSIDEPALRRGVRLFKALAAYHRLEVRHIRRIPRGPCILAANHNGGTYPVDGLFLVDYYRQFGFDEPVYILTHMALTRWAPLRRLVAQVGMIPAGREEARAVLRQGHKLLVFPGGDVESLRPFKQRRQVMLAGHTGFARLAVDAQVPVVPIVSAGAQETLIVLRQGKGLALRMRLPSWARLHSAPTVLCLPWGLVWGPACALPYVPLPARVTVEVDQPIEPAWWQALAGDARAQAAALYRHVRGRMQTMLDATYAERVLPVLG